MSYPSAKVHRPSRRKLGKGQFPTAANPTVSVTSTGTTNATLTFNLPVAVNANIPMTVAGLTLVSQTVVSPTVVTQVWSGNVTGLAYSVPSGTPTVSTYSGGQLVGSTGHFP